MHLLNVIVLKSFLFSIFCVNYVYARYPFVSAEFIEYKVGNSTPRVCGARTWLPLQRPKKNCDKEINLFRAHFYINNESIAAFMEKRLRGECHYAEKHNNFSFTMYASFEKESLHDLLLLCGTSIPCKDLEDEVNLDIFWKRIVDHNKTRKECNEIFGEVNVTKFTCPFSSRIDLQFYAFIISGKKPEFRKNINESELCVDRYGRKYPPPQGLGGKCVMFQHEFEENGIPKTEFFMPIEKRDLIQRISQYPLTHALRQNETTLNRFLPREYVINKEKRQHESNETNCLTLHYNNEAFIHCIYNASDSKMFQRSNQNYYYCPKGENITKSFLQSELTNTLIDYEKQPKYTSRNISEKKFDLSEYCYISTDFTLNVTENGDIKIELNANFVGSNKSKCLKKLIVEAKNGTDVAEYEQKLIESIEDFCPWENNTTYNICFKTKSEHHFSLYVEALNKIANASVFSFCHFQVQSDGCYYQIDLTNGSTSRVPSKWIPFIESEELNATKKDYKNETGCGIVYISPEMKRPCYEKSKGKMKEYSLGSDVVICKCNKPSCDAPHFVDATKLALYRNALVCNQGSSEIVLSSPFFYCSVRLTITPQNGKKVKVFNYSFVDQNLPYELDFYKCWDYQTLSNNLADPEADEKEFTTCFHSHEDEIYECCCKASDTPCNTHQIIEAYHEIANQEAKEHENRLLIGCNFKTIISQSINETCKMDQVRNDREMRCYGIFKISSISDGKNSLKPKLMKENCYWPHPQYHDQYSVFCSNAFFDIDELIEEKCLSVVINDFTSSSTATMEEKKFDKIMILCCNTGVYSKKRDSILSRSLTVL